MMRALLLAGLHSLSGSQQNYVCRCRRWRAVSTRVTSRVANQTARRLESAGRADAETQGVRCILEIKIQLAGVCQREAQVAGAGGRLHGNGNPSAQAARWIFSKIFRAEARQRNGWGATLWVRYSGKWSASVPRRCEIHHAGYTPPSTDRTGAPPSWSRRRKWG